MYIAVLSFLEDVLRTFITLIEIETNFYSSYKVKIVYNNNNY